MVRSKKENIEEKEGREANTKQEAINTGQTGGISRCRSNLYSSRARNISREDTTQTTERCKVNNMQQCL